MNNHFVTIPKEEFEEMQRIVCQKKDIDVTFNLVIGDTRYFNESLFFCTRKVYSLNNAISYDKIDETEKLIYEACKKVAEEKDKEIDELKKQLSKKWWKIF